MNVLGLMLLSHEDDVLADVLARNLPYVDSFYVLDGTVPNDYSRTTCEMTGKCSGYFVDDELPHPPYPEQPLDGWRQYLLQAAYRDFGYDNWFVLLHGDEVWTRDPREVIAEYPGADGFIFLEPFYFPREPWDDDVPALEQLKWHLGPGFPEFRMFRGGQGVAYDPGQYMSTRPSGVALVASVPYAIKHYLYRSPDAQRERARLRTASGFDPINYDHIVNGDQVYWTDAAIADWQARYGERYWGTLARDE